MKYNFDEINNRYNTGSYKYDSVKRNYPEANNDTIIMTLADMDFKTAPEVIDYLSNITNKGIFGYMTEYFPLYQESVKKWYRENHNFNVEADEIIFSNGTIEGIKAIISLFTDEGDYIALSRPVYGHFSYSIEAECRRKVKNIQLLEKNGYYTYDFDALYNELNNENVKIYILCSPHNPVGRVWKYEELQKIIDICHKTNTLLISDEVHFDIVRKGVTHHPILSVGTDHTNIIMFSSPGKTFNVSGLQVSNMIIKDKKLFEFVRNNYDHDISTFAQAGLIGCYQYGKKWKEALNEYIDGSLNEAISFINDNMPYCKVHKPEGTYFLWLNFEDTKLTTNEINEIIYKKANVILQEGTNCDPDFGGSYQRMPIALPRCLLMEALHRIRDAFCNYLEGKHE